MNFGALIQPLKQAMRDLDARWHRLQSPYVRDVVFDARTAMEYGMMAPVHRRLLTDPRVRPWLMSSAYPSRVGEIFRDAPWEAAVCSPREAMLKRFDAYVASDLVWATLPRGARRVQMFHGVAGKWRRVYDQPSTQHLHALLGSPLLHQSPSDAELHGERGDRQR